MPDPLSETRASDVPLAAQGLVTEAIHGAKVESRIDANYVAWKALKALTEAGYPIYWQCSGCCNCTPSNFTDPICNGKGEPIR